eukprot:356902-Chlamydomonas_euryale.AAC.2
MQSKRRAGMVWLMARAEPAPVQDFAMELFRQLDRSRKGAVSVRDLLNWASERCNSSGHVVPTDYLVRQFRRADIDLLGELDFEGVLLLQARLCCMYALSKRTHA